MLGPLKVSNPKENSNHLALCPERQTLPSLSSSGRIYKRLTDIALCLPTTLLFLPLMLLIAICIKIDSPGPVIFKQKRVGRQGKLFDIYKFRTMRQGTPNLATNLMQNMQSAITPVGGFLRKTSLDELPQIFNVLKDEMTIVGPRPALYNQTELTELRQKAGVLNFLPGITGWAQVNGRDELPDQTKVEMDKWYCTHWTYTLDWQIIFMTVKTVITRRGAF
ncbi:MAG: sugar transferase [Candidatus Obscuribacterales bacterium]|nr:sugar transferase [Candidatus Obscuribacterales bacterium]